jgi:hypothetical protein
MGCDLGPIWLPVSTITKLFSGALLAMWYKDYKAIPDIGPTKRLERGTRGETLLADSPFAVCETRPDTEELVEDSLSLAF